MYHETHIFMFGLKNEKPYTIDTCSCFIHLQAVGQRNGQTDG